MGSASARPPSLPTKSILQAQQSQPKKMDTLVNKCRLDREPTAETPKCSKTITLNLRETDKKRVHLRKEMEFYEIESGV